MTLTPEISVQLALDIRMSSEADVSAEFTRQLSKILRVAAVSSNLKGANIKDLKDAATYVAAAWRELNLQRAEVVPSGSSTAARFAEARLTALEEENTALRKEITRLAARTNECPRCNDRAIESGHPPREGNQEGASLDALEKRHGRTRSLHHEGHRGTVRGPKTAQSRTPAQGGQTRRPTRQPSRNAPKGAGGWRMESDEKAAAEEKDRKEGGEKRGNACHFFDKARGRRALHQRPRKERRRRGKRPGSPAQHVRPR
jgi:hypothetical protein